MTCSIEITSNAASFLTGDMVADWGDWLHGVFGELGNEGFDSEAILDEYTDQIQLLVLRKRDMDLAGNFIYGPYGTDRDVEAIREEVAAVDFDAIVTKYEINN